MAFVLRDVTSKGRDVYLMKEGGASWQRVSAGQREGQAQRLVGSSCGPYDLHMFVTGGMGTLAGRKGQDVSWLLPLGWRAMGQCVFSRHSVIAQPSSWSGRITGTPVAGHSSYRISGRRANGTPSGVAVAGWRPWAKPADVSCCPVSVAAPGLRLPLLLPELRAAAAKSPAHCTRWLLVPPTPRSLPGKLLVRPDPALSPTASVDSALVPWNRWWLPPLCSVAIFFL